LEIFTGFFTRRWSTPYLCSQNITEKAKTGAFYPLELKLSLTIFGSEQKSGSCSGGSFVRNETGRNEGDWKEINADKGLKRINRLVEPVSPFQCAEACFLFLNIADSEITAIIIHANI